MEISELVRTIGGLGVLFTAISGIIIAIISNRKSKAEAAAVSTQAIEKLVNSIKVMTNTLDELRKSHRAEADVLNDRIHSLEDELIRKDNAIRDTLDKLHRVEQASKDRSHNLKKRVKTLEENGGDEC